MTYNLTLVALVVIAVLIGTKLGKGGPKWKAPLIAVSIFIIALIILNALGLTNNI